MDIFEILREAKNPSNSPKSETLKIDDDTESTDYTEDVEEDIDETEDISEEETEDDVDVSDEEESTDDDESEEEPTDYTTEMDEVSSDDGSETDDSENESDDADSSDSESTDNNSEEQDNKGSSAQDVTLLNSSVKLYYNLKDAISKLDHINQIDMVANKIIIQVKKNLSNLIDELYEFITRTYSLNNYVKNLYTYNYFIEAYKVNVEMLKKISVFTTNT